MNAARPVKIFNPEHWAQPLDVPAGTRYVEADDVNGIIDALRAGLAVHSTSCGGHVFIWPETPGNFAANHFFQGPPSRMRFETAEAASEFAASCAR